MIEASEISRDFGARRALDRATFTIEPGSITGLLGRNGAGKTTLLRLVAGVLSPSSGTLRIAGVDVAGDPRGARERIGYLPENAPVHESATVAEMLGHAAELRGIPRSGCRVAIGRALESTDLGGVEHRLAGRLSRGFRRRLGLALAVLGEPPVLLLDEPTAGLDPEQAAELRRFVHALAGRTTVVFSSHLLGDVAPVCDRVLVLGAGRVLAHEATGDLERRLSPATRLRLRVEAPTGDVLATVRAVPGIVVAEARGAEIRVEAASRAALGGVSRAIAARGWSVLEMTPEEPSLERALLALLGGGGPSGSA